MRGAARPGIALEALARGRLDALDALDQLAAGAGELGPALLVELENRARQVAVRAVEAAGGGRGPRVLVDRLQRRADRRLLGHRRRLRPRLLGDRRQLLGAVVVRDGAADPRLVDELA